MFGSFRSRALVMFVLVLSASALPAAPARAQTEPVQFTLTGTITDGGATPIDHARLIVTVEGTTQILADQIFTAADGSFSATFQAEVIPNVGLDDPILPPGPTAYDGYWMGNAHPNPFVPGTATGLTLSFAAPTSVSARPDLELFDARGRRIRTGDQMASGVYFYRLNFDGRVTDARKLVLLGATRIQPNLRRVADPRSIDKPAAGGGTAARRAEGEAFVDIAVLKPGFEGMIDTVTLNSRIDNHFDAQLNAAPVPTAQLAITGTLSQGEAVLYDGLGSTVSGDPKLDYSWDFGDGAHGGGQLIAHVYSQPGDYTVALTVSSVHGATATTSQLITIAPAAPPASMAASSTGTIRDATGNLLQSVTVSLVDGTSTGDSDALGLVTLSGLPTGVPIALLCEKPGYTRQIIRITLPANTTDSEFRATLRRQRGAIEVDRIEDGTDQEGEDGVCLELPPEALVKQDGTPVTGAVELRLTPIDVSSPTESGAFPGSYEGVLSDGQRGLIVSYGTAEFVIEQGGEKLQLKPGSTATVEIPVYTPGAAVDDVIALWSVDESTGLWTEEGTGIVVASEDSPTGLALRAQVTHFSWWNCDDFLGDPYLPVPECKIKDQDGLPTLDIPVGGTCYIEGQLLAPNGPTSRPSITLPPGGGVPLRLPPNLDVQLTASTANGTKRGVVVVNGPSDLMEVITIALDDPPVSENAIVLPADLEAAIDPAGEIDSYTFEATAGQFVNAYVSRISGSTLEGEMRIFAPDDTETHMSTFTVNGTSHVQEITQTGTWRIEVDGTANEPGAYQLVAEFAEAFDATVGAVIDGDLRPGRARIFNIPVTAGEWFSVNFLRRETVGFGTIGELRVESPSGAVLFEITFGLAAVDSRLIQATETGNYRVLLASRNIEAAYSLFVRDVPELVVGGVFAGSSDERAVRYFRFDAANGDFLRSALDKVVNFSGNVNFFDGDNNFISGSYDYSVADGTPPTLFNNAGSYFVKLESTFTTTRSSRDFRLSLNDILPPEPVSFDGAGRGLVHGGQIGLFGDMRLYQFTAPAGSGLVVDLRVGDLTSLEISTTTQVHRVGSGSYTDPIQTIEEDYSLNHYGDASLGLLQFGGYVLPSNDTYLVMINAPAPQDGEFDLTLELVAPSATLTVDDDLLDCPGADTRSLLAAGLVAPTGGTINVCAGTYSNLVGVTIKSPGVSLVGSSAAEVTLRMTSRGSVIYWENAPAYVANLTLENTQAQFSKGMYLTSSDNSVIEDLVIRPVLSSGALPTGIDLGGTSSGATFRRLQIENCDRSIEGRISDTLIEDCQFSTGFQALDLEGNSLTVQNNTWNSDRIGQVIILEKGAGHQVLNNQITIATPDFGAASNTKAVLVEDDDASDALPATVIRGNSITTNEAGFDLQLGRTGSSIICEQNLVLMTDRGKTALALIPRWDAPSTAVIRNNVFNGLSAFEGIHVRWADWYGSVEVTNNTMLVNTDGPLQLTYPTVRIDLRSGSTFTGALPVQFVNNVMQGAGNGVAVTIPTDTTIDSDYNLMNGFATWYDTGTTSSGTNDLLGVDPMFAAGNLLQLEAASQGVDSGASSDEVSSVPAVDYDGTARPQGAGTDRGAHER